MISMTLPITKTMVILAETVSLPFVCLHICICVCTFVFKISWDISSSNILARQPLMNFGKFQLPADHIHEKDETNVGRGSTWSSPASVLAPSAKLRSKSKPRSSCSSLSNYYLKKEMSPVRDLRRLPGVWWFHASYCKYKHREPDPIKIWCLK